VIYYPTVMARYSLFVLKVPFKPQANKQTKLQISAIDLQTVTVLIRPQIRCALCRVPPSVTSFESLFVTV